MYASDSSSGRRDVGESEEPEEEEPDEETFEEDDSYTTDNGIGEIIDVCVCSALLSSTRVDDEC